MSVEVEAEVQSVKMTEDILRDVPDAVLSHLENKNNAIITIIIIIIITLANTAFLSSPQPSAVALATP